MNRSRRFSLEAIKRLAKANEGKCLSDTYTSSCSKVLWQCKNSHQWEATPYTVAKGHWCAKCSAINSGKKRQFYSIEKLNEIAQTRNGVCLSGEYLGYDVHHLWQCQDGHQWLTTPDHVVQGKWCPKCSKRKHFTEEKCRFIIEQLTGLDFPSSRKALGNCQELDLYNESHKVAIEYHGIQHYKIVKGWHKDQEGFKRGQERDCRKIKRCRDLGIRLFVVSYKQSRHDDYLIARIKEIVNEAGLPLIKQIIDMTGFYNKLSTLKELDKIARQLGGKCLSREYINCETKIQFRCAKAHVFMMEPRHVKAGHWCKECGHVTVGNKNRKLSLVDAQKAAEGRGGKCLSVVYRGTHHKMKWKCSEGHVWESKFDQVRRGSWCNICSYQKLRATLESVQDAAKSRGGRCISTDYVNSKTKMEFECGEGHRWWACPGSIKQGSWCFKCYHNIIV